MLIKELREGVKSLLWRQRLYMSGVVLIGCGIVVFTLWNSSKNT